MLGICIDTPNVAAEEDEGEAIADVNLDNQFKLNGNKDSTTIRYF